MSSHPKSQKRSHPSPDKLAHVVFRTNPEMYQAMVDFYLQILNANIRHEDPGKIAFLSFDEEHHRLAILAVPGLRTPSPDDPPRVGLDHIAFTYKNLTQLAQLYVGLRDHLSAPLKPVWSINHGPTTSLYYRDPQGNKVEMQVDNFDTMDKADAYMKSNEFAENPLGVEFDPDEWSRKILAKMQPDGSEGRTLGQDQTFHKKSSSALFERTKCPFNMFMRVKARARASDKEPQASNYVIEKGCETGAG
ncbi:biphenyl-2,3-diol 1,2-dioxygenase, putative [Talaromyces stipitatus ATCC 10500]|uniref:Biphenyl-2,3-diol 1,2-dioxygenase, putative n=1 Tax=Talaromyces stipitatus (strain ATCC 10500 / CBS 375.48 / QM 6759 / NRRL 1006) TaxID=441959 RepID=B8LWX6_TALSN|nr:biphenyl-2,3-diol 1,2-dioxygenase, putative [Talaromyces stipitatus ATCC 10500]EED24609.1 biphenyl-2,3-diol 1,2-dioxygenase, putative [Talaromyces stipitatus ATCC 10500]